MARARFAGVQVGERAVELEGRGPRRVLLERGLRLEERGERRVVAVNDRVIDGGVSYRSDAGRELDSRAAARRARFPRRRGGGRR